MAKFEITGLDALAAEMRRMGQESGPLVAAMVSAGAAAAREVWKAVAEEHDLRDTGAMIESIGFPHPVKTVADAAWQDIYPLGKDSRGVRNAEKAFILHYGTSRIKATYWCDEAMSRSTGPVYESMEAVWDEFLKTGNVPVVNQGAGGEGGGISKTKT